MTEKLSSCSTLPKKLLFVMMQSTEKLSALRRTRNLNNSEKFVELSLNHLPINVGNTKLEPL